MGEKAQAAATLVEFLGVRTIRDGLLGSLSWGVLSTMDEKALAAATLKELRFPSPGLRAKSATLGSVPPTNLATL